MKHNHDAWCKRVAQHGFDYVASLYSANLRELYNKKASVHNVEWTTDAALEFIKSSKKPFFLYYATTTPHGPAPWMKTDGKYVHGLDADPRMTGEGWVEKDYSFMPTREAIKQEALASGTSLEDAWMVWIDHALGAIRRQLEKQGILDNTLIIITSDHGAWRHGKTTLHEGGLRVPLAMHWPKHIQGGSSYDELVQNIDFTPTILDIAGVKPPEEMQLDGLSLKSVLQGSRQPVHDHLFAELGYSRSLLTKDWKYIAVRYDEPINKQIAKNRPFIGFEGEEMKAPYLTRNGHLGFHASRHNPHYFETDQLYHMSEDPEEKHNLADKYPEKIKKMQALLKAQLATFPNRPFGELTN
jgi:arylsulfatase A-like enzyme